MNSKRFSEEISVFRGRISPENGFCAGYFALIRFYDLNVPLPDRLCVISKKFKKYENDAWLIFEPKYVPEDSLAGNLVFALKYEGIDLGVLNSLFKVVSEDEITGLVLNEPLGKYSRKIWFLYEWLTKRKKKEAKKKEKITTITDLFCLLFLGQDSDEVMSFNYD